MSPRYGYSLHEAAIRAIIAASEAERNELLRFFESLARDPASVGAEIVRDPTGRRNEVAYTAQFRVVYWIDHAIKEVRIMDIRRY